MDYTKLNELVKIQKKADASKDKKQEYAKEMKNLFIEEGYSAAAEKYLYEGFAFMGSETIALYIKNQPSSARSEILSSIINGKYYKSNDKGMAFKLLVSLLCQTLNMFPEEALFVETIIKDMLVKSKNKENRLFGDAAKTIEKYFVSSLDQKVNLPNLAQLNLRPFFVSQFCSFLLLMMSELKPTKYMPINVIEKVTDWVNSISLDESKTQTSQTQVEKQQFSNITTTAKNQIEINKYFKSQELIDLAKLMESFTPRFIATANHIQSIEKGMNTLDKKTVSLNIEVADLKAENKGLRETIEKQNQAYEKIESEKYVAINEISCLKKAMAEKETIIESMENEISRLNSIISVYSSDKQNSQNEQLNSIASKLKAEYLDFKDVEHEETSLDLGENFRQQISTIFKILAKSGIDVGRR